MQAPLSLDLSSIGTDKDPRYLCSASQHGSLPPTTSALPSISPRCIIAGPPLGWKYSALSFGYLHLHRWVRGRRSMTLFRPLPQMDTTVTFMEIVASSVAGDCPPLPRVW